MTSEQAIKHLASNGAHLTVCVLTIDELHDLITDAVRRALPLRVENVKTSPAPVQMPMMVEPPAKVKTSPTIDTTHAQSQAAQSKNDPFGMSTQQAADELHVSVGTVNRLINDGKLPAIIIGRKRFIKRRDIVALIKRTR